MVETLHAPALAAHGASRLPSVEVDSYNLETRDDEGFIGDRVNKGAFRVLVENWRKVLRKRGEDPFGDAKTQDISKQEFDKHLTEGDPEAGAIVQGAIEEFAQELAVVIRRYLKLKAWRDTERVAVGGGFRAGRIGELAIARTGIILKADKVEVDLTPIRNDPNEAGLIGAAHLVPAWMLKGHDAILAVDIGGTNIRAGVVDLNLKKSPDLSKACVWKYDLWRHADEADVTRDEAVKRLVVMIERLIGRARKADIKLTPFIGVSCPGVIEADGSIDRGAQNLPGNWQSSKFNLPASLRDAIPTIDGQDVGVIMHNDAVVQGLSETPFMQDVKHWGVLTIGTGLGNARFTNRSAET